MAKNKDVILVKKELKKLHKEFDLFEERCKEIKRDFYETIAKIHETA